MWACATNTHLPGTAVQHELSRAVSSTHIQQDVSRAIELAKVLRLAQGLRLVHTIRAYAITAYLREKKKMCALFKMIYMCNRQISPSCVEVGNAALEILFSQEQSATCVRYGQASALLLTLVFIVDHQLGAVEKNNHSTCLHIRTKFVYRSVFLIVLIFSFFLRLR